MVVGHGGKDIRRGTHVMNVLGSYLIPYFVSDFPATMEKCLQLIYGEHYDSGISFASSILNFMLRNSELRKK